MSKPNKDIQISSGINALQIILSNIIKRPKEYTSDAELRTALKTQNNLAKLQRSVTTEHGSEISTYPMSLNSLKTYSSHKISGGYKSLDDLRRKAISALDYSEKRATRANKRSKSGLTLKVSELETELEILRQTNLILLSALGEALHQFVVIRDGSDNASRTDRAETASTTLRAIVSMNIHPFDQLSRPSPAPSLEVTDLNEYRNR
jgi:hypothetical protein